MPVRLTCRPLMIGPAVGAVFGASLACALWSRAPLAQAQEASAESILPVRSRNVELHYRVHDCGPEAEVELWYTRDHARTWQQGVLHTDLSSPLVFEAPAEGLYGIYLIVRDRHDTSSSAPDANTSPQRWIFVDYTPPLVQWDTIEPVDSFAARRILQLRWTAHDDNLPTRPVALSFQTSLDQKWHVIEAALANSGQYDWRLPADVAGQITLKITVRDQGGHLVERLHGPVPIDHWMTAGVALETPATRPASSPGAAVATRPAYVAPEPPPFDLTVEATPGISLEDRKKAEDLWTQGSGHAMRHEYAVAAARFREAISINPHMLRAMYDLGAIHYLQKDYPRALELFNGVLAQDPSHELALRGAHETYIAQRRYAESYEVLRRLLDLKQGRDPRTLLDLGDVLFMMEDRGGARAYWQRAATIDPESRDVVRAARERLLAYPEARGEPPGQAQANR